MPLWRYLKLFYFDHFKNICFISFYVKNICFSGLLDNYWLYLYKYIKILCFSPEAKLHFLWSISLVTSFPLAKLLIFTWNMLLPDCPVTCSFSSFTSPFSMFPMLSILFNHDLASLLSQPDHILIHLFIFNCICMINEKCFSFLKQSHCIFKYFIYF